MSHVQTRPFFYHWPKAVTPCPPCEMAPLWEIRRSGYDERAATRRRENRSDCVFLDERTTLPPGSTVLNRLAHYIYIIYIYIYLIYNDIYIYRYRYILIYVIYDLSRWDMTVCVLHHHIWQFFVRSFHCSWSVNIPTCDSDCHLVSPH